MLADPSAFGFEVEPTPKRRGRPFCLDNSLVVELLDADLKRVLSAVRPGDRPSHFRLEVSVHCPDESGWSRVVGHHVTQLGEDESDIPPPAFPPLTPCLLTSWARQISATIECGLRYLRKSPARGSNGEKAPIVSAEEGQERSIDFEVVSGRRHPEGAGWQSAVPTQLATGPWSIFPLDTSSTTMRLRPKSPTVSPQRRQNGARAL